jgi:hypothetical protein
MSAKPQLQASEFWRRISKPLHERYDPIMQRPLPQRWVDLILCPDDKHVGPQRDGGSKVAGGGIGQPVPR